MSNLSIHVHPPKDYKTESGSTYLHYVLNRTWCFLSLFLLFVERFFFDFNIFTFYLLQLLYDCWRSFSRIVIRFPLPSFLFHLLFLIALQLAYLFAGNVGQIDFLKSDIARILIARVMMIEKVKVKYRI